MDTKILLLTIVATFLTSETLAAELQKFRDHFVNVDRMWEDDDNVHFEKIHGVPTDIYAVGICNPNLARIRNRNLTLPKRPQKLYYPRCLPFSAVGFAINSVAIYHPLAGGNVNAVEGGTAEGFDICGGHADPSESYHYHKIPEKHLDPYEARNNSHAPHRHLCPYEEGQVDKIIGVSYDGFMLYGPIVTIGGRTYDFRNTNNPATGISLDQCHGIEIDAENGQYAYIANLVYPYMLGCYRGLPTLQTEQSDRGYECLTVRQGELCDCCQGLLTREDTTEEEEPCPYSCRYDETGEFGNLPPPTQNIVSNVANPGNVQNNAATGNRWVKQEPFSPLASRLRQAGTPRNSLLELFQPHRNNLNNPARVPMWYSFNRQTVEQSMPPRQETASGTYIPRDGDNGVGLTMNDNDNQHDDNDNDMVGGDGNDNANVPERCQRPGGDGGDGGDAPPKKGIPPGGWGEEGPPPKKEGECPRVGVRAVGTRKKRALLENLVKKLAAFN